MHEKVPWKSLEWDGGRGISGQLPAQDGYKSLYWRFICSSLILPHFDEVSKHFSLIFPCCYMPWLFSGLFTLCPPKKCFLKFFSGREKEISYWPSFFFFCR